MTGVPYMRWKAGNPRTSDVLRPLKPDHPAFGDLCAVCNKPLGGRGAAVQLYALGPDSEESQEQHDNGCWYSAQAALLHAACAIVYDIWRSAEAVRRELGEPTVGGRHTCATSRRHCHHSKMREP